MDLAHDTPIELTGIVVEQQPTSFLISSQTRTRVFLPATSTPVPSVGAEVTITGRILRRPGSSGLTVQAVHLSVQGEELGLRTPIRRGIRAVIAKGVPARNRPLLEAILIGSRGEIAPTTREAFAVTGAAHLLSISGLHVGLLGVIASLVLRALGVSPLVQRAGVGLVLIGFLALVGPRPPIVRATIAGLVFFLAPSRGDVWNRLALACVAVLVWDPAAIWSVGFQLSFGTVAGMLALGPALGRRLQARRWDRPRSWTRGILVGTCVAFCASTPLLGVCLGELPLVALALAPIAIATFSLLLAAAVVGVGLGVFWPPASWPALALASGLADVLVGLVRWAADLMPARGVVAPSAASPVLAIGLLALAAARCERGASCRTLGRVGVLLLAALILPRPAAPSWRAPEVIALRQAAIVAPGPGQDARLLGPRPARYQASRIRRHLRAPRLFDASPAARAVAETQDLCVIRVNGRRVIWSRGDAARQLIVRAPPGAWRADVWVRHGRASPTLLRAFQPGAVMRHGAPCF